MAGEEHDEQVAAANVDTVFLVSGLDHDFNLRRIERYLVMAWDSGARPVILLNKADLSADAEAARREVEAIAGGAPVHVVSVREGRGLDQLEPYLRPRETVALLGSSGVGKSTLLNRLSGVEKQPTRAVRASDSRGRHTTSHRQIFVLPSGALMLDTPGMRELQLWDAGGGPRRHVRGRGDAGRLLPLRQLLSRHGARLRGARRNRARHEMPRGSTPT